MESDILHCFLQENFFRNFGSILTFAFLGTFISAVGVGCVNCEKHLASCCLIVSGQGARLSLLIPGTGILGYYPAGVLDLRLHTVCN